MSSDYGRRIVLDSTFDAAVIELSEAIRSEGLQTIAGLDVRDHLRRQAGHDFRRYQLIAAWSPDLALEALRIDLDAGTILPTTFAVYQLADGETAVVAREPLAPMTDDAGWRHAIPPLAAIAERESERVARVLERLLHHRFGTEAISTAA